MEDLSREFYPGEAIAPSAAKVPITPSPKAAGREGGWMKTTQQTVAALATANLTLKIVLKITEEVKSFFQVPDLSGLFTRMMRVSITNSCLR